MERRQFLMNAATGLVAGTAAGSLAAPAIAQAPAVRWRYVTSWPKSLDTVHGSAELLAKRVAQLTDNKFEIRVFASGEIVPALQVFDAVQNNTVECGHTLTSFYIGKNPAFAFDAGVAFGMNTRQQNAWLYYGGGLDLMRELFKRDNILPIPCGNVGVQMGGWFRKEIKTVEDLSGLKFRIGGLGGRILTKLGIVPQQIAASDIYSALEKGTIDGAEWIGPYDDEKLGFHRVAKYYYYPGWWEGSAMITTLVNLKAWEGLPQGYRDAFETACAEQNVLMVAKYDALNPAALRRLVAGGVQLRGFPRPVMEASFKATNETYAELSQANADFKRIYESWKKFLDESNAWFRVAENTLDNFRYAMSRAK
jgi:TRAP-type mannitol/chloroaromatic compound transport system substrate-binding protein